jgi:Tripartite ATP-independent periplasmic transporters, DctQ component
MAPVPQVDQATEARMRNGLVRLVEAWALVGGLLLIAIVLVTTTNVLAFGFDKLARIWGGTVAGLPGYEDFVALSISVAALSFFPYCQLRRGHVAVDLFVARAPLAFRRVLGLLWLVCAIGVALFLAYWMSVGMLESRGDNVVSPVLGWPVWPFYGPGVVSLALWAAVAALQIAQGDLDG